MNTTETVNALCFYGEYPPGWHVLGEIGGGPTQTMLAFENLQVEIECYSKNLKPGEEYAPDVKVICMTRDEYNNVPEV